MSSRALTKEEHLKVKDLFTSLRNKCLYILGKNTGFRISELLCISIQDVKNKDFVKVTRKNMKGKTESREVILNREAKESINEYLNSFDSNLNGPLFKSREGHLKPITRFMASKILKNAFNAAKLQGTCTTHSMRKSWAMNVYEGSNHDLIMVSKGLGHKNLSTTIKYLPVNQDKLNKIILGE